MKYQTVQAGIPEAHWRAIRALAWKRGISQADLIRSLVLVEITECQAEADAAIMAYDAHVEAERETHRAARAARDSVDNRPGAYVTGFVFRGGV